ncbi:hypothetical protein Hanom_Chr06g00559881 [Helianthus anomalus]
MSNTSNFKLKKQKNNNWVIIDGALLSLIPLRPFVKNAHNAPLLTRMTRVTQCPWVGALFMFTTTHGGLMGFICTQTNRLLQFLSPHKIHIYSILKFRLIDTINPAALVIESA